MSILFTKKNILLSSFILGFITGALAIFDVQFMYLKPIFSMAFLAIVPGLLLMLILRIKELDFWEGLLILLSLSITFLMFAGLGVNFLLPWLHITDQPLTLLPLLGSFNILLTFLGIAAYRSNKMIETRVTIPKVNILSQSFFALQVIFPLLSAMSATSLNNGGSNIFLIITLTLIAATIPVILFNKGKLNINYGLSIYSISLSLILMISYRGLYLFGSDIQTEYLVYNLTNTYGRWQINNLPGDLYNMCLSITILPAVISKITGIDSLTIFKLILPLFFSLVPVGIYVFAKNYFGKTKAYLSALFFLSLSGYYNIFATHERQGVSTLFFVLMMFVLFSKNLSQMKKNLLALILGLSMIFSHYSTALVALLLLSLIYFVMFVVKNIISKKVNLFKSLLPFEPKIAIMILLFFWVILFAWYTQSTKNNSNYFTSYINLTINNLKYTFSNQMKADRGSIIQQLNIFYKPQPQKILNEAYKSSVKEEKGDSNYNTTPSFNDYNISYIPSAITKLKINPAVASVILYSGEFIKRVGLIFMLFGLYHLIFTAIKKRETSLTFVSLIGVCSFVTLGSMIIPFVSIGYDIVRIFQQCLVFLSMLSVMGIYFLIQKLNNTLKLIVLSAFFIMHFLTFTVYIYELTGGGTPSIQFNNTGYDYDLNYVHPEEIKAITWLSKNDHNSDIYVDLANYKKIQFVDNNMKVFYSELMIPSQIWKDDYVYYGYTNTRENRAIAWINSISIGYNTPTEFLDENKNIIYSNGGSKIYK